MARNLPTDPVVDYKISKETRRPWAKGLFLVLFLQLGIYSSVVAAPRGNTRPGPVVITWQGCLPVGLVLRKGQESCWVRIELSDSKSICMDRHHWQTILSSQNHCGAIQGRWKPGATLKNQPSDQKNLFLMLKANKWRSTGWTPHSRIFRWQAQVWLQIESVREWVYKRIENYDHLGIFRKLLLHQGQSRSQIDLLRLIGFVHLLSAAGIHLYAIQYALERLNRSWIRLLPKAWINVAWVYRLRWIGDGISHLAWISLWILSGLRWGMLRPWLIVGWRTAARRLGFRFSLFFPLFAAIALEGFLAWKMEMGEWTQFGRWHYFLAVAGGLAVITLEPTGRARVTRWKDHHLFHLRLSVGSWIPTALYDACTVKLVAWATPLISLISIPVFCTWLLPGVLLGLLLEGINGEPSEHLIPGFIFLGNQLVIFLLEWSVSASSLWRIEPWAIFYGMGVATFGVFFSQLKSPLLRRFAIGGLFIFVLVLGVRGSPQQYLHRLEQLDVGQGDAAIVWWGSRSNAIGMIDAGPPDVLTAAQWIELWAMRSIERLDWVIISHGDDDHRGGLPLIKKLISIDQIMIHPEEIRVSGSAQLDEQFVVENLEIDILTADQSSGNSKMLATHAPQAFLSAGDALSQHDSQLSDNRDWKVIKINHHGSASAYRKIPQYLIQAEELWISSGTGNHFGHPTWRVIEKLKRHTHAEVKRTDSEGHQIQTFDQANVIAKSSKRLPESWWSP